MKKTNWKKFLTTAALCTSMAVGTMGFSLTAFGATINTNGVNIRNDASTESGVIGSLFEGDVVDILETVSAEDGTTWYKIRLSNGNTGFVRSDFVNDDGSVAEQTQSAAEETEETPAENEQEATEAETPAQVTEATEDSENTETVAEDATVQAAEVAEPSSVNTNEGQTTTGVAKGWRTAAIVFGILLIAAIGFILFLLKSIFEGRKKPRRRAAAVEEIEDDEEFFDFDDAADEDDEEEFGEVQDETEDEIEADEADDLEVVDSEVLTEEEEPVQEYDFDDEEEFEEAETEEVDAEDGDESDDEYFDDLDDLDEDDETAPSRKEGGFFGFMKKLLRSDEDEDEDDEEVYDDDEFVEVDADPEEEDSYEFEEEDSYEFGEGFDEEAEYPEDVDLLPKKAPVKEPVKDFEEEVVEADEMESSAQDEQIKLYMDKVMRNIKAEAEEEFISDKDVDFDDSSEEELDDALFDDDDDMEYSFLNARRNK